MTKSTHSDDDDNELMREFPSVSIDQLQQQNVLIAYEIRHRRSSSFLEKDNDDLSLSSNENKSSLHRSISMQTNIMDSEKKTNNKKNKYKNKPTLPLPENLKSNFPRSASIEFS